MIDYINRLKQKYPFLEQFSKFIVVGVINTGIDFAVLNLLMYVTGKEKGIYYSVFKSISFIVAVTNSYYMNRRWTFAETGKANNLEFMRFIGIYLIGWGVNVSVASYMVNVVGAPKIFSPVLWANIGAVSAVAVTLFWSFLGMKFFIFNKKKTNPNTA
jgi:putative flippase GtrA